MTLLARSIRALRRFVRAGDGSISIELAITLSLITAMVIPMVDIGMGMYTQMQVENAAQAGAQFATVNGWNSTNVSTAVTSATSLSGVSATPAPSESCGCVVGGAITAATCGTTCSGNSATAGTFVTVNSQAQYSTLFNYPGITNPMNLVAQSIVRIK